MTAGRLDDLCATVAEALGLPLGAIDARASMATVSEWTSLSHLQVMLAVEARYGVRFRTEEIPRLTSVAALAGRLDIPVP
jgi:acyl carrier protein